MVRFGREDEEVVDAVRQVQIADEGTHQAGLAHARGQREAQRREVALEVGDEREFGLDRPERRRRVRAFGRRRDLHDAIQNLERPSLRLAEAQPPGNRVHVPIHSPLPVVERGSAAIVR